MLKSLALVASLLPVAAFAEEDKDTIVVVPETGHLAIKPSRNFTGPTGVIVSSFYGSGNASSPGLKFTNQELGEGIIIANPANSSSGYILTAKPGQYTLKLTDQTATKQFKSTTAYWTAETGTVYRKDCMVFKFVNTTEKVGFERDEKYAAQGYNYCDMAEGEHLYLPLTTKPLERIVATLQTTKDALSFIPWSETWGCPMVDASGINTVNGNAATDGKVYDLQGRRVEGQPQKGLYITNGKKYIAR